MPTNEERLTILRMIEQGKISAEDGTRLIQALGGDATDVAPAAASKAQFMRIRVTDSVTGRQKVSVNVPLAIVTLGLRFVPDSGPPPSTRERTEPSPSRVTIAEPAGASSGVRISVPSSAKVIE